MPNRDVILNGYHTTEAGSLGIGIRGCKSQQWTDEEHAKFLEIIEKHGQTWKNDISSHMKELNKTAEQISQHLKQYVELCRRNSKLPLAKFVIKNYSY